MGVKKKIFAVSDVHGYYTLLEEALDKAGFDSENEQHLLVCCGDYFDRGIENYHVLKYFDCLKNKVMLRGNHEDMLLKILDTGRLEAHNYINGTIETILEFFGKYAIDSMGNIDFSGKNRMWDRVNEFISETTDYFETEHFVFVHGWLPTVKKNETVQIDRNWRNASKDSWIKARWAKWDDMYEVSDRIPDKTIVCGHYPTFFASKYDATRQKDDADIFYGNGVTVIDAGTHTSGKVNVLVVEDELLE